MRGLMLGTAGKQYVQVVKGLRAKGGRCLPARARNGGKGDELRRELLDERGILVLRQLLALLRLLFVVSAFLCARGRGQAQVWSPPRPLLVLS